MLKLKACQGSGGLEPNRQTISKTKSELSSRALEAKPGQQSENGRKDGALRKTKKLLEIKKNTGISNPQEMEG